MSSVEYKVPRILWESLESVLLAQSKRYVGELARRLQIPEKELLRRVLPSAESLKVYIQDSSLETNQCKAYIQDNQITGFCRKPVAHSSEFCQFHNHQRMTVIKETQPHILKRIKDRNDCGKMWIKDTTTLLNSSGSTVGKINHNDAKIKLFVIK